MADKNESSMAPADLKAVSAPDVKAVSAPVDLKAGTAPADLKAVSTPTDARITPGTQGNFDSEAARVLGAEFGKAFSEHTLRSSGPALATPNMSVVAPGGRYLNKQKRLVNAHGEPINDDGSLVDPVAGQLDPYRNMTR